jgi:hypothetical protein
MAVEPLIKKLSQILKNAQQTLRMQFLSKIEQLSVKVDKDSTTDLRDELQSIVDDFLSDFTTTYQDIIMSIEDELPELGLKAELVIPDKEMPKEKPKKKQKPKDPEKPDFIKPTLVKQVINDSGMRVSKEARPMLMDILNETIKKDIDRIKQQLPTFQKGEKQGEKKRITIKPEDVTREKLAAPLVAGSTKETGKIERELDSIAIDGMEPGCSIITLLRAKQP